MKRYRKRLQSSKRQTYAVYAPAVYIVYRQRLHQCIHPTYRKCARWVSKFCIQRATTKWYMPCVYIVCAQRLQQCVNPTLTQFTRRLYIMVAQRNKKLEIIASSQKDKLIIKNEKFSHIFLILKNFFRQCYQLQLKFTLFL